MSLRTPRPIEASDPCADFGCGETTLDNWVRLRAIKNEANGASRTFVSIDTQTGTVAGYYSISAGSLRHEDATAALRQNMPDPIPVILIGRLAVDKRYQNGGLGASLLKDALTRGMTAAETVGSRAFIVHAISERAQAFYERWGFALVPGSNRTMYLLMKDARETVRGL